MGESWELEIEPEVRHWLDTLSARDYLQVERAALAMKTCRAEEHFAHDEFTREIGKGEI